MFRSLKRKQRKENIKVIPKNGFLQNKESKKNVLDSLSFTNEDNRESKTSSSNDWVEEMNRKNKKKSYNDLQGAAWDQNQEIESSQASPEFSPILYWREPIPEVEIVDLDPQPSTSKNIKKESKGKSKEQTKIHPLGKIM